MSAAVENHRISQVGALSRMAITKLDLPNTKNPLNKGAWYECTNEVLVQVLLPLDSTVKATRAGSEFSAHFTRPAKFTQVSGRPKEDR